MTERAVELVEADASAHPSPLEPFDEQASFDVASGVRALFELRADGAHAGSAVLGDGALDLFIRPDSRGRGLGAAAAEQLLARAGAGPLTAWSHEDHPAARALAARFGFDAVRTLLQLRLELGPPMASHAAPNASPHMQIMPFRPGTDDREWLALNARVFAWHPEQGGIAQHDLEQRMAEPWFCPEDFLVARDAADTMVGYCWLKAAGSEAGEIYVIGVAPEASGRGLGRALMAAGLNRLRERGCTAAELYVEADNTAAVALYRSLGFGDASVHVQYARA